MGKSYLLIALHSPVRPAKKAGVQGRNSLSKAVVTSCGLLIVRGGELVHSLNLNFGAGLRDGYTGDP